MLRAVIGGGRMTARHLLALAVAVVFFAACGGSDEPSRRGTATPGIDLPQPQRVSFAPGEVVSADGAGIFFADPYTGAIEGWVIPGTKEMFDFWVKDVTTDGKLVLVDCVWRRGDGNLIPCGSNDRLGPRFWYLFDTQTGERQHLDGLTSSLVTLSPDGGMLFALEKSRAVFQPVNGGEAHYVQLPYDSPFEPFGASWSPKGDAIVVGLTHDGGTAGEQPVDTMLFRADAAGPIKLLEGKSSAAWSPDGSRLALGLWDFTYNGQTPGTLVFDANGRQLWSSLLGGYPNLRWSPDDSKLAAQVELKKDPNYPLGILALDVLDGATGEPLYRILGASCSGAEWTADSSHLIVDDAQHPGDVLVDLATGTFKWPPMGFDPTPFDANLGLGGCPDGVPGTPSASANYCTFDLRTGEVRPLVQIRTQAPWEPPIRSQFVGRRIAFMLGFGGHGGCGEGQAPQPPLQFLYPPYGE